MKAEKVMHGAYKTPGGKMVVVNCVVTGGALRSVQVSGDFFLYPEEALALINGALEGASSSESAQALADRVEQALSPDVVMLGFSPDAVSRAVRNALGEDANAGG